MLSASEVNSYISSCRDVKTCNQAVLSVLHILFHACPTSAPRTANQTAFELSKLSFICTLVEELTDTTQGKMVPLGVSHLNFTPQNKIILRFCFPVIAVFQHHGG